MKLKRFDKRLLPMLWVGLGLWFGTMLILFILGKIGDVGDGQETLMAMSKVMFQRMPVFTLLLMCLIQPVLEELSFRLWGVGKLWAIIVCLCLMAMFTIGSIGLWGVLCVGAFIVVWLCFKGNKLLQLWLMSIVSALTFTVCHISGFGDISIGTIMGLTEIFGMALVLAWLTINISFWLGALLHVLNNSVALLSMVMVLPATVTQEGKSVEAGVTHYQYAMSIEPLKPLANNRELIDNSYSWWMIDSSTNSFYMVGEPAEIACELAEALQDEDMDTLYYDWESMNLTLEERIVLKVDSIDNLSRDGAEILKYYLSAAGQYRNKPIVTDTIDVMLKEIWLIYPDGHEELLSDDSDDLYEAWSRVVTSTYGMRGNEIIENYENVDDTTVVTRYYCYERPNQIGEMVEQMMPLRKVTDKLYGYRIEYRDGKKVKYVVFK